MPLAISSYCPNKHVVRNVYSIEKYLKKPDANLTVFISNMFSEFNKMHKIEIKHFLRAETERVENFQKNIHRTSFDYQVNPL